MHGNPFNIRDINYYPILYTVIIKNIDIFIIDDNDFLDMNIKIPKIMTSADFAERFIKIVNLLMNINNIVIKLKN